jgi:hypothetical protein
VIFGEFSLKSKSKLEVNMNKFLSIILLIAVSLPLLAEDATGQAGAYLKMGVGARALGMGGAFTAIANDATAAFWNPAGLVQLDKKSISTMHTVLKLDRTYNFVNYVQPLKKRKAAWGINYTRFGVDNMNETHIWRFTDSTHTTASRTLVYGDPVTTTDGKIIPVTTGDSAISTSYTGLNYSTWKALYGGNNLEIFSTFDDNEWALSLSYAKAINKKFNLGGNLKYLKQELFNYSADSYSLDLGALYALNYKTRIGLSIRDIGAKLKWNTPTGHSDKVPVTSTLGIAYSPIKSINIDLDYTSIDNGENVFHAGIEGFIKDKFGVRIGSDDGNFTMGTSVKADGWDFDYAFRDQVLGKEHRLSATYKF